MKVADEGIQSADEIGVSHAAALKLLHQLDFRATSSNDLLGQLGDFTQQFPASEVGVYLYSIVGANSGSRDAVNWRIRCCSRAPRPTPAIVASVAC